MIQKFFQNAKRGQAIVMIAVMLVGLIAIIGLLTDGGTLLIEYARLKRGIDSASIGAAQQFRKNFTQADLNNAAQEFLQLNQSDVFDVQTDTCLNHPGDPVLCTTPLRKLVRVTASRHVNFGFLRVIGINSTDITATSIGEAASVDLVLVIDTSISMAAGTTGDPNIIDPGDDPSQCNLNNTCQPLANVKSIARTFAAKLFYPYDRVAIVALTSQSVNGTRDPIMVWQLQSTGDGPTDQANVDSHLAGLKVFQPRTCTNPLSNDNLPGPCLNYPDGVNFAGQECPMYRNTNPNDPTTCNSTNGGGGLLLAGSEFTDSSISVRKDSFWAVIALFSGTPNSSFPWAGDTGHPNGYCPNYGGLWGVPNGGPLCIQPSMDWTTLTGDPTRHYITNGNPSPNYTSLDYARDMADYVADPVNGQGASIFTIGLGNRVENSSTYNGTADPAEAEKFLKYAASTAGGTSANHGKYYYAPDTSTLDTIFLDIYKNITTRISQ